MRSTRPRQTCGTTDPDVWLWERCHGGSITRYQKELEEALAQERAALEAALREKEAERQAKESALQEKDAALAEIARLQALLRTERPRGED